MGENSRGSKAHRTDITLARKLYEPCKYLRENATPEVILMATPLLTTQIWRTVRDHKLDPGNADYVSIEENTFISMLKLRIMHHGEHKLLGCSSSRSFLFLGFLNLFCWLLRNSEVFSHS